MKNVQAFITNISYPKDLDQLVNYLERIYKQGIVHDIDAVLNYSSVNFTAPKWCMTGDVVFFMHAKTTNARISRISSEYRGRYSEFSEIFQAYIKFALNRAREI